MEGTGLKKKDLKRFKDTLLAKKKEILRNAQRTLNEDMTLDADDLPDEMDLASSEYLHSFTFRLRGREKVFLAKIDHALEKIKEGTFGSFTVTASGSPATPCRASSSRARAGPPARPAWPPARAPSPRSPRWPSCATAASRAAGPRCARCCARRATESVVASPPRILQRREGGDPARRP